MKKRFIAIVAMLLVAVTMTSCSYGKYKNAKTKKESYAGGYFTEIKEWGNWHIVYANDTKVMYIVFYGGYKCGISPLYNSDGSLQVYAGED